MILRQMILRPIYHRQSTSRSSTSVDTSNSLPVLLSAKSDPVNVDDETLAEVISILKQENQIESALDPLARKLCPSLLFCVVQNPPTTKSCFRFFIWTTRRSRFRKRKLQDLIISMLAQEGGFDMYWKTLEELRDSEVKISSHAFAVLISAYWKIGDAEKAVEVFGTMRKNFGCEPNVDVYNAILNIMVKKKAFLGALALYNQMLKANCKPNLSTYNILMSGHWKNGSSGGALDLMDEMIKSGITPNNTTYSILLSALCEDNRADDALLLFDKIFDSGCQPDEITYNSLLSGLCKLGKLDEAFVRLRSFQKQGYEIGIKGYSCLIDGLVKAGRLEEAHQWFNRYFEESRVPDVILYSIMIRGFSTAGRVNDALHLMKEMTDRGLVPDTLCYNALIKGFCDLGSLEDAQSLKLEMSKNGCSPNAYTYTILISAMCEHGLVTEATQIFKEMDKLGCSPSVVTFNSLINGLCKTGDLTAGLHLFFEMEIGKQPSMFLGLTQGADRNRESAGMGKWVEQLCELGEFVKAYRLLTKLADSVSPNINTYNILINNLCKGNKIQEAMALWKQLQTKGLKPDSVTYGTMIDGLCQVDEVEAAYKLLDQITENRALSSLSSYYSLMTWLCRKRRVLGSLTLWLKYLRSTDEYDDGVVMLIEDHLEKGNLVEAINALLEMNLKMEGSALFPYSMWLAGLCQAKNVEEALIVFHILEEHKIHITRSGCEKLIKSLCHEGKLGGAVDVFLCTLEKGTILKPRICNVLLSFLLRSPSERKHAFDLLSRMESAGYDMNTYIFDNTRALLKTHTSSMVSLIMKKKETAPR